MTQAQAVLDTGFAAHLAVHGETATFTPAGGAASSIQVIFDEAAEIADPQTGILTTAPQARAWSSQVPSPDNGRLALGGVTYNVVLAKADGLGVTHMTLSRDTMIPIAPSGLTGIVNGGFPQLDWVRNATNNTAVEVWRATGAGSFALLTTLSAATVSYQDGSAFVGNTYHYKVRNTNGSGPSPFSNQVSVTP